jgi:small basic protein
MMSRAELNIAVNVLLLASFLVAFITGVLKITALEGLIESLGLDIELLSIIHDLSGMLMGILVFAHIAIYRKTLIIMLRRVLCRG